MAQAWTWIYGIKPRDPWAMNDPPVVESRWLDAQRPLWDSEVDQQVQGLMNPNWTNLYGVKVPATFQHVWTATYDTRTRSFGPWRRHYWRA